MDATQALLDGLARKTRELARLTIVDADRLVWIGSAQGAAPGLLYQPAMGGRIVSYATANGKAWLATLPKHEAERIAVRDGIAARQLPTDVGPNAYRTSAALHRDLSAIRLGASRYPMKKPNPALRRWLLPFGIARRVAHWAPQVLPGQASDCR